MMWSSCRLEGKKGKRSFDVGKCERTSCRRQVLWELRFEDRPGCVSLLAPACLCVGGVPRGAGARKRSRPFQKDQRGNSARSAAGVSAFSRASNPRPDRHQMMRQQISIKMSQRGARGVPTTVTSVI
jgi:hypothetical protein